jgi:hypothetical protein
MQHMRHMELVACCSCQKLTANRNSKALERLKPLRFHQLKTL